MSKNSFPSAQMIVDEASKINKNNDLNKIHTLTFDLMKKHRKDYYKEKVAIFLQRIFFKSLSNATRNKIKEELLRPVSGGEIVYSNMMEEASRRISQTFQVISGNIAEICIERELQREGLKEGINYIKKKDHTDFIIFYPNKNNFSKKYRIEVKNVTLRERGTRGFAFDGDSMIGFFNDEKEFTDENIKIINSRCKKTGGYCYLPPILIEKLTFKIRDKKFKQNILFASDIVNFIKTGII